MNAPDWTEAEGYGHRIRYRWLDERRVEIEHFVETRGDGRSIFDPEKPCGGCGGSGEQVYEIVQVGPVEYEYRELGGQREVFG